MSPSSAPLHTALVALARDPLSIPVTWQFLLMWVARFGTWKAIFPCNLVTKQHNFIYLSHLPFRALIKHMLIVDLILFCIFIYIIILAVKYCEWHPCFCVKPFSIANRLSSGYFPFFFKVSTKVDGVRKRDTSLLAWTVSRSRL
jgi:hypothetical protein